MAYNSAPNAPIAALVAGKPSYSYGSFNTRVPNTQMSVSKVAITSNVATLTVQVLTGEIPAVGSLVSVTGTQTNSSIFNVSNVALTGVTIDAVTGAGTITFALTHADVSTTTDNGTAIVKTPEVAVALANGSGTQFAIQHNSAVPQNGRTVAAVVSLPSLPTTATVTLQGAIADQDSEYADIFTVASVTGGVMTGGSGSVSIVNYNFVRLHVASVTGGSSPTIVGKILI